MPGIAVAAAVARFLWAIMDDGVTQLPVRLIRSWNERKQKTSHLLSGQAVKIQDAWKSRNVSVLCKPAIALPPIATVAGVMKA